MDVRDFIRSTRPASFSLPVENAPPAVTSERGEQDHWSRPIDVEALAAELVNAPQIKTIIIPDGTHFLFLDRPERGRDRFVRAVQTFLDKASE